MGHPVIKASELVVVGISEVGRTGGFIVPVEESSGQTSVSHPRLVGQQPPPREAGQERKPEEHDKLLETREVVAVVVVVEVVLCEVGGSGGSDSVGGAATMVEVGVAADD